MHVVRGRPFPSSVFFYLYCFLPALLFRVPPWGAFHSFPAISGRLFSTSDRCFSATPRCHYFLYTSLASPSAAFPPPFTLAFFLPASPPPRVHRGRRPCADLVTPLLPQSLVSAPSISWLGKNAFFFARNPRLPVSPSLLPQLFLFTGVTYFCSATPVGSSVKF